MNVFKLPRAEDVQDFQIGNQKLTLVTHTKENHEALVEAALSTYLGEHCKYCNKEYKTIDDLNDTVWAGVHERGRLACESCWKENN